jgi:hypothetical protein
VTTGNPAGIAPTLARILSCSLALLMLHWGATSVPSGEIAQPRAAGVQVVEHARPLVVTATAPPVAARPRHSERAETPVGGEKPAALMATAHAVRSEHPFLAVRATVGGRKTPYPVHAFDARAPPHRG